MEEEAFNADTWYLEDYVDKRGKPRDRKIMQQHLSKS